LPTVNCGRRIAALAVQHGRNVKYWREFKMKKHIFTHVLALMLCLLLIPALAGSVFAADTVTVQPTVSTVLVNGESVTFDAYNINGNNFFKLRDLAYTLSGTDKQFDVGWDGANNSISLASGRPYTAVGGEMQGKGADDKQANPMTSRIYLDDKEISFTVYNIEGNNYFKLRDIGETFDFGVDWDAESNTIAIDTGKGYELEASGANDPFIILGVRHVGDDTYVKDITAEAGEQIEAAVTVRNTTGRIVDMNGLVSLDDILSIVPDSAELTTSLGTAKITTDITEQHSWGMMDQYDAELDQGWAILRFKIQVPDEDKLLSGTKDYELSSQVTAYDQDGEIISDTEIYNAYITISGK
jgi:hypothetical protein